MGIPGALGQLSLGGLEGILPKNGPAAGEGERGRQLFPSTSDRRSCQGQRGSSGHHSEPHAKPHAELFVAFSPCFQAGVPLPRGWNPAGSGSSITSGFG